MAILQTQNTVSNGYFLNSIAALQSSRSAFFSNPVNSLLSYKTNATSAIGSPQSGLVFSSAHQTIVLGKYQDYQSRFARFFGENAKQDVNFLYVLKSDLIISSSINNTAESIFVALMLQILIYESNSEISTVFVEKFSNYLSNKNNIDFVNNNLIIKLYQPIYSVNDMYYYDIELTPNSFN